MKTPLRLVAAIAGCCALIAAATSLDAAAKPKTPPEIGAAFPAFTLTDTTGKEHQLSDYKGKILVLNFCSHSCPFSRGADPAISAVAEAFKDKDVVFLGVDSNKDHAAGDIDEHIKRAGIPYPILKDTGNVLADEVGARVTPELYVIDKDGKLAYHGAPDDRAGPESTPMNHYLRDAVTALVDGKAVEKPSVTAWGCGIKRAS